MYNSSTIRGAANTGAGSRVFRYEVVGLSQNAEAGRWATAFAAVAVCSSRFPMIG